jgi:hypothetical protein
LVQRFGGDAEIGFAVDQPLSDLRRAALVQFQANRRMLLHEALDHRRQRVARLGVGGGDGQRALIAGGKIRADALQVLRIAQNPRGQVEYHAAWIGDADQPFAAALENGDAQLLFEQANLLGDARLRSGQRVGGGGNVEVLPFDFDQIAELLEFHGGIIEIFVLSK